MYSFSLTEEWPSNSSRKPRPADIDYFRKEPAGGGVEQ